MPLRCAVPNCNISKTKEKLHIFSVPKDNDMREKWKKSIGICALRGGQKICEKHFDDKFIIKEYIKYDQEGKIIAQVPLKCARLEKGAVPTIFEQSSILKHKNPQQNKNQVQNILLDHNYSYNVKIRDATNLNDDTIFQSDCNSTQGILQQNKENLMEASHTSDNSCTMNEVAATSFLNKVNSHCTDLKLSISMYKELEEECLTDLSQTMLQENALSESSNCLSLATESEDLLNVNVLNVDSILKDSDIQDESKEKLSVRSTLLDKEEKTVHKSVKNLRIHSSLHYAGFIFNFYSQNEDAAKNTVEINDLPKPWSMTKTMFEKEEVLLFTYTVTYKTVGKDKHIFEKTIIIKSTSEIIYEIFRQMLMML